MYFISFCFLRFFGFLLSLLPTPVLHAFGRITGTCAFYLHRNFRKKALSNLAIAYGTTKSEKERKQIAIRSFRNLMITCLEFFCLNPKLATLKENPEVIDLLERKQGVIFLSAHQANWEIPFIALTKHYPGIAIGRPIKNRWLYRWVLSMREMNGGKIVMPKSAIRQGMKALKEGKFLGIVGDQAYPESSYSYSLFGTRAWTTSTPALLAYKTQCPIVVGTTRRIGNHYEVSGSSPIWPDISKPIKDEVPRMMDQAMQTLEKSIEEKPEQWMWVHDRWKQQGIDHVKRKYRFGFILLVNPDLKLLPLLRKIYPRSFLTIFLPKGEEYPTNTEFEIKRYEKEEDLLIRDWRFQLVLDFYDSPKMRRHFRKLGAFKTLSLSSDAEIIKRTLVKPECLTTVSF